MLIKKLLNKSAIDISQKIIYRFSDIKFLNDNREFSDKYIVITELKKADKFCRSIEWENLNLDKRNDLTEYLFINYKDLYNNTWNKLIDDSDEIISNIINKLDFYIAEGKITENIRNDVKYNFHGLINYQIYKENICGLQIPFFEELLDVYEQGYIPVSYQGEYPKGQFIVI